MQLFRVLTDILDARQRRRYAWLQLYFVFAALVQVASVASIAPFIALVAQPRLIHTTPIAQMVYEQIGFASDRAFLAAFALMLMILVVLANAVPAVMLWLTWTFSQRVGSELQADLFRGIMHWDIAELARVNSAILVRDVLYGTSRVVHMVIQPVLNLVSSTFVIVLLTAGLVLFDPVVAVVASVIIGGGYTIVFLVNKRQLGRHGAAAWAVAEMKTRVLNESFGGMHEIRLAGTAPRFEQRLTDLTRQSLRSEAMVGMLGDLPRFLLEAISLCALLGLGVYLLFTSQETARIVAVLSLYAMAGYRLLPAAQTAFRSASSIRANIGALRDLEPAIRLGREVARESASSPVLSRSGPIEFRDVLYRYPKTTQHVLDRVSFQIAPNSITAIVGTSGAGKSTVASLLLGLLRPTEGDILFAGQSVLDRMRPWQEQLAYVSQNVFIVDDSIGANIAFASRSAFDAERMKKAAQQANLADFIDGLPAGYDHGVGERGALLSGGQRQRIGIARALYNDASVIVLDEPTSALDSATERGIIATLEALRATKTIVMVSHRLSTLQSADQIIMLAEGRVRATGTFQELFAGVDEFRDLVTSESASAEEAVLPPDPARVTTV